jgi:acetylornithine/N-succinyldiaminopimelate aminotransferase
VSLSNLFDRFVCPTSPYPNRLEVARAAGCRIVDTQGREYLDFISGIAVTNVGHCHPDVVAAVQQQAGLYSHTMVYGEHIQAPQVELARELGRIAPPPLDTTYFLTTGAEANDAALKLAIKLTGRARLCAFDRAYHGDTVGALACFGDARFREQFAPLLPACDFLPFGDVAALERIGRQHAAVIVEPVQGEAGIIPPPHGFLQALRARCSEVGALLIFDEVQTAFGRVGNWFAAREFGVTPDLIIVAKALGAGMPLAGVIGPRDMMRRFAAEPPFSHITTFGGNPVCCAAGLAGLRVIARDNLLENAREMGDYLVMRLAATAAESKPLVRHNRGIGLMIGCELRDAQVAREVIARCQSSGLIVESTLLNEAVIRLSPPLIVTREECDFAIDTLGEAFAAVGT